MDTLLFIIFIIAAIGLISSSGYWLFIKNDAKIYCITFWVITFGVMFTFLIVMRQELFFGIEIKEMSCNTAEFYFSNLINGLVALFSSTIIAISILWRLTKDTKFLQKQSIFLLLFLIYIALLLLTTIIQDFNYVIINKCI